MLVIYASQTSVSSSHAVDDASKRHTSTCSIQQAHGQQKNPSTAKSSRNLKPAGTLNGVHTAPKCCSKDLLALNSMLTQQRWGCKTSACMHTIVTSMYRVHTRHRHQ